MIFPKEVRAQRLSVSLGAPRRDWVFDRFLFARAVQQEKEQLLVFYYCTWYVVYIIRVCSVREFLFYFKRLTFSMVYVVQQQHEAKN